MNCATSLPNLPVMCETAVLVTLCCYQSSRCQMQMFVEYFTLPVAKTADLARNS
jgi:hypothetical protein